MPADFSASKLVKGTPIGVMVMGWQLASQPQTLLERLRPVDRTELLVPADHSADIAVHGLDEERMVPPGRPAFARHLAAEDRVLEVVSTACASMQRSSTLVPLKASFTRTASSTATQMPSRSDTGGQRVCTKSMNHAYVRFLCLTLVTV